MVGPIHYAVNSPCEIKATIKYIEQFIAVLYKL